jgi:hypothetical protein
MNKAFVREPDFDGRAFCPRCGALGLPVEHGPLDAHIQPASRAQKWWQEPLFGHERQGGRGGEGGTADGR